MDVGLGWLGVGVGAAGSAATYALASASVERDAESGAGGGAWLAAGLTVVLTLVFWGVSLCTAPPFSPGQTLGWGFLIGGILGAIMVLAMPRFDALGCVGSTRAGYLLGCCASFWALFGASLTYSIFHGYPQEALVGFAIGAVMAAVLARAVGAGSQIPPHQFADLWMLFAVLIAAGTVLSVLHFNSNIERAWWPLPILLATTVCIAAYIGAEIGSAGRLSERPGASFVLSALVASMLLLALGAIYAWRIADDWQFFAVVAAGVAVAAVITWLAASVGSTDDPTRGVEASAASAVLVIALAVVAFRLWGGLGIALGLIGGWSVILPAAGLCVSVTSLPPTAGSEAIPRALRTAITFGLTIVLFRVFMEYYRTDLGTTDLRIHYTFVGALLGFVVPVVFTAWVLRLGSKLWSLALVSLLAAASPLVLFVLWEIKAAMGYMLGLALAAAGALMGVPSRKAAGDARDYTAPLVIGAQLVAIQFITPMMTIEDTRTTRVWVLAAVVLLGVIWLIAGGAADRRRAR